MERLHRGQATALIDLQWSLAGYTRLAPKPDNGRRTLVKHPKLDILEDKGFVILKPYDGDIDPSEWEQLTYLDWKSGGDTNFAVLASATGEDDARGFWEHGKADKDGIWAPNAEKAPTLKKWVENVGARFGRVRIIKLEPSTSEEEVSGKFLHLDDNNRLNPEGDAWVV